MNTSPNPHSGKPLLSPLGRQTGWANRLRDTVQRLPPAAAPIAFTLVGGVVMLAIVATMLAGDPAREPAGASPSAAATPSAAVEEAAAAEPNATVPEPSEADAAMATASTPPPAVADERPAEPAAMPETVTPPVADAAQPAIDLIAPEDRTASIPPALPGGAFVPVVEVAETSDEIEALEAIQREEVAEDVGEPSLEETAAIPPAAGPRAPATTTKWVNMRSGPSDDAGILEVVPALAIVDAETACDWCSVSYEGREGFIYKTFLSYGDGAAEEGAASE